MHNAIFILKGNLRKKIIKTLARKPMTGKELGCHLTSISRSLIELEEYRFVKCINNDDDRFRFYQLTAKGKKTLEEIPKLEY
jgi:DNA-binding PadR family transcriptional regulator